MSLHRTIRGTPGSITLLAGGRGADQDTIEQVLASALTAAGARPQVAYLGSANGDDPGFFTRVSAWLHDAGAADVLHVRPAQPGARALLDRANLVFVSGGDVEEGISRLHSSDWITPLRELHRAGTPFCGLSAGSIMLAREWVRWPDPDDDSRSERFDCLALADVRVDTHGEADDWQELASLLRLCGDGACGYGLRSGSALQISGPGTLRVVAGTVDVYENHDGQITSPDVLTPGRTDAP